MIRIFAVGRLRTEWTRVACEDYRRRASRFARIDVVEVPDTGPEREGRTVLGAIGRDHLVTCDRRGEQISSEDLAALLGRHGSIALTIGGPDGLSVALQERADASIAFGRITLPHELARVVLLEQVYRALSIRAGHPYHR
ncbi:MAG TPA: 23S rRNA (pseudouridine(1915)-N(3))-methyltransferase RlmH [Candidatus Krumholzibacteria bacterium]|nr:23S rRNA (pseudouridine(1915)-N(3))-methyltransferase RlmH [Candidatus Krumholzibacteria bacterium]